MTEEALVLLKGERGKAKEVLKYVGRSKTGQIGWDQEYAEDGVKIVFQTSGDFDVIAQVLKSNRREIDELVKDIKKHVKVRKFEIQPLRPKMPGDP
jgi:hypothetical protein